MSRQPRCHIDLPLVTDRVKNFNKMRQIVQGTQGQPRSFSEVVRTPTQYAAWNTGASNSKSNNLYTETGRFSGVSPRDTGCDGVKANTPAPYRSRSSSIEPKSHHQRVISITPTSSSSVGSSRSGSSNIGPPSTRSSNTEASRVGSRGPGSSCQQVCQSTSTGITMRLYNTRPSKKSATIPTQGYHSSEGGSSFGVTSRTRSTRVDASRSADDDLGGPVPSRSSRSSVTGAGPSLCSSRRNSFQSADQDSGVGDDLQNQLPRANPSRSAQRDDDSAAASSSRTEGRRSRSRERSEPERLRSASQGLRNLGNTCYINSILQCLAKLPWLEDGSGHSRVPKFQDGLLTEFVELMAAMQTNVSEEAIDPGRFRNKISALGTRFSSYKQNDAHEFLHCLLVQLSKGMEKELSAKRNPVKEFLSGEQRMDIKFGICGHHLDPRQPFYTVSLPIPCEPSPSSRRRSVDLSECIDLFTREEEMDGPALCLECSCTERPCTTRTSFQKLPEFLILHFKRYDFYRLEKLETAIRFPVKGLRVPERPDSSSQEVVRLIEYDLFAVCNHYGSLGFGHYTADVRTKRSGHWYNYSDSCVRPSDARFASIEGVVSSSEAYILFYQRRDTESD